MMFMNTTTTHICALPAFSRRYILVGYFITVNCCKIMLTGGGKPKLALRSQLSNTRLSCKHARVFVE
jgi:hypothetical protein